MNCDKPVYDNNVATNYDCDREKEEHWNKENYFIKKYFYNKKIKNLLDIPVGTGRFLNSYQLIDNVVGIDISDAMLHEAQIKVVKGVLSNIKLEVGDVFSLKFPDNFFDHTVCFRLLHLIPPEFRIEFISELMRVTSGKMILQVYEGKKINMINKILNKMKTVIQNIIPSLNKEIHKEPWSHITSYSINKKELEGIIKTLKLHIFEEILLCKYKGHTNVKVYILSKNN